MHFDAVQMRFCFTLSSFETLNGDDLKEHRRDDHELGVWMENCICNFDSRINFLVCLCRTQLGFETDSIKPSVAELRETPSEQIDLPGNLADG